MTDPLRDRRPVVHKDAVGETRAAWGWESLTERLIREGQEAGAFEDLPASGRPLTLEDDSYAGESSLAFHVLHNAGVAPAWIDADGQARRLRGEIDDTIDSAIDASSLGRQLLRSRLEQLLDAHADAVTRLAATAPTERQHRSQLDRPEILRRFDDHRRASS